MERQNRMSYDWFNIDNNAEVSAIISKEIFKCSYCKIEFDTSGELQDHLKVCLRNPVNWEKCQYCSKKYQNIERHEKNCKKHPDNIQKSEKVSPDILNQINENLQEVLKYAKIGQKHVLNEENIILFLRTLTNEKAKLFDFTRHFHENSTHEIDVLIKNMYQKKILVKDKNYFYKLK